MAFLYSQEFLNSGLTYKSYRQAINETLAQPAPDDAAQKLRPYTVKNVELMDSYDTTYRVSDSLKAAVSAAPATIWVVITEGWCGDAAFNVPMFAAIENAAPEKVRLSIFFRDSNLELMDANLTDGGRSIPKLIVLNEDFKELGSWGPRPDGLQDLMKIWKSEGLGLKELIPKVHEWYDRDATKSVQDELIKLVESYS